MGDEILSRHTRQRDRNDKTGKRITAYPALRISGAVYCFEQAIKVGVNLIVLDDGWFGKRKDDNSSLGDWIVNLSKFPQGLKALVDDINALGCKFGIWIEPEMVSEDSVSSIASLTV